MRRAALTWARLGVIPVAVVALAGCSGGSAAPSSSSSTAAAVSTTVAGSTATTGKTARRPKHTFELADCLHAERAATRLATDAIRNDKGNRGKGADGLMRTDLTTLVSDLHRIFPSTSGEGGQLRRTRGALTALEGQDAAAVVHGLGQAPVKNLASLLKRACG